MDQCSGCRFWLNWDSEMTNLGECHRFPPRMASAHRVEGDQTLFSTVRPEDGGWPLTYPDEWCGEFQIAPERFEQGRAAPAMKDADVGPAL
jgi:hypothetical protein